MQKDCEFEASPGYIARLFHLKRGKKSKGGVELAMARFGGGVLAETSEALGSSLTTVEPGTGGYW